MLRQLSVKNYALIEDLMLRPAIGMSVITGETGAGKSILLGALELLLGERSQGGKILLHETQKCVIEGLFDLSRYALKSFFETQDIDYASETMLRRELLPGGKSRAFVNDTPVGLDLMRALGEQLIDIHSQHETTLLVKGNFQRWTLDSWAANQALYTTYRKALAAYKAAQKDYEARKKAWEEHQSQQDYAQYQLKELQAAALQNEEQEQLEKRLKWIEGQQNRAAAYEKVLTILQENNPSLLGQLGQLVHTLQALSLSEKNIEDLAQRSESARLELKDIAETLEKNQKNDLISEQDSEQIQERLSLIYDLQKKHRLNSCEELLQLQHELEAKAASIEQEEAELQKNQKRLKEAETVLQSAAEELSASRRKATAPFSEAVVKHLQALGMPQARFSVSHSTCPFQQDGIDQLSFFFSANKGISAQPLAHVASGGEKSRLMFVIKYLLAAKQSLPTLIFDEIDTGISGETAKRMIDMMQQISQKHQVILISHLPQFAARAATHFFIYKEEKAGRTISKMRNLSESERIQVLAEMIDGENPSREALENARSMREA